MTHMTFIELGEHDEHSIVMQDVLRLEALAETRAGHVVEKGGAPVFKSTMVVFKDHSSIVVPHTKKEILDRFLQAARPAAE
jgi:hypothetical protein